MRRIATAFALILLPFLYTHSASASEVLLVTPYVEGSDTLTSLLSIQSVSTGGSGGEDRLTDVLDTVFISTGGSGGEDRITDLFDTFSVSTGGSGGEDRITQQFDQVVNVQSGTTLSGFLATIPLSSPSSTVYLTAYDLFDELYVSAEVAAVLSDYDSYRVENSASVSAPEALFLLLSGLSLLFVRESGG